MLSSSGLINSTDFRAILGMNSSKLSCILRIQSFHSSYTPKFMTDTNAFRSSMLLSSIFPKSIRVCWSSSWKKQCVMCDTPYRLQIYLRSTLDILSLSNNSLIIGSSSSMSCYKSLLIIDNINSMRTSILCASSLFSCY